LRLDGQVRREEANDGTISSLAGVDLSYLPSDRFRENNKPICIDGVADSFVIGTTSNAENSTMRFYHVRASAPERDENRELFQPRGIFMENEEIRDWSIRKSPRRTSAIRFTMIVIALLNSRRRPLPDLAFHDVTRHIGF